MIMGPMMPRGGPPTAGPPNQAELPFWIDGFDINLLSNAGIADTDPIGTWKNKGSQAATNDAVQATAILKPLFTLSAINGHPGVTFAALQFLAGPLKAVANSAARHIFSVVQVPVGGFAFFYVPGAVAFASYALGLGDASAQIETDSATTNNFIPAAPTAGFHIVEYSFDGVTSNNCTFVIDGVAKSVTNGVGTGVGTEASADGTQVGSSAAATVGVIGEILSYSAVQSAGNVTAARGYLSAKWGIAA